jgi:hypothetical protein
MIPCLNSAHLTEIMAVFLYGAKACCGLYYVWNFDNVIGAISMSLLLRLNDFANVVEGYMTD